MSGVNLPTPAVIIICRWSEHSFYTQSIRLINPLGHIQLKYSLAVHWSCDYQVAIGWSIDRLIGSETGT